MSMCQIGCCTKDATQETEMTVGDSYGEGYTELVLMCDEHMVQFKTAGQISSNRALWRMS